METTQTIEASPAAAPVLAAPVEVKYEITVEKKPAKFEDEEPSGDCVIIHYPLSGRITHVIEVPEHLRFVSFKNLKVYNPPKVFEFVLSWPRTLWWINSTRKNNCHFPLQEALVLVSAIKQPFSEKKLATELYHLPMPNVTFLNGTLCGYVCIGRGTDSAFPVRAPGHVANTMYARQCVAAVLSSVWSTSIEPSFYGTNLKSIDDWHNKTAADPDFHKTLTLRKQMLYSGKQLVTVVETLKTLDGYYNNC